MDVQSIFTTRERFFQEIALENNQNKLSTKSCEDYTNFERNNPKIRINYINSEK